MRALVIHPRIDLWAGGEYIGLEVCKALLNQGFEVSLACENYDLIGADRYWEMSKTMQSCDWIPLPKCLPRLRPAQRLAYLSQVKHAFEQTRSDLVINTQMSTYWRLMKNAKCNVVYDGDLNYLYHKDGGVRGLYYDMIRGILSHEQAS